MGGVVEDVVFFWLFFDFFEIVDEDAIVSDENLVEDYMEETETFLLED